VEAMALGVPVVAYAVGGLRETVVDIRGDSENGTGFLVEPENIWELGRALTTSLLLSIATEKKDTSILNNPNLIYKPESVDFWDKVRENSIRRVEENFRWSTSVNQLLNCYSKAQTMAKYRVLASF
jgi:starch synthase